MADKLANGLFISELLADNAGNGATDTDGDGDGGNHSDEFVEIQNKSTSTVSLDGIQIWTQKNGLLYSFGPGDTLAAGGTATLVGQYDGAEPPNYYDAGLAEGDRLLQDGEGNKSDSVFLYDSNTNTYVVLSYGQPPDPPSLPVGFPAGATQNGAGESINSNAPNGVGFARDSTGTLIETTPTPGTPDVPCFVTGTLIQTPNGARPIETLQANDIVLNEAGRPMLLLGVGTVRLGNHVLEALPQLRPIIFPIGSIGNTEELGLSPNHRVAIASPELSILTGHARAFVPAKSMVGINGAHQSDEEGAVVYMHLLFERHEILEVSGARLESLFFGKMARTMVDETNGMRNWSLAPNVCLDQVNHQLALPSLSYRTAVNVCKPTTNIYAGL